MAVIIDKYGRGMTVRDPGKEKAKDFIDRAKKRYKRASKSSRRSSSRSNKVTTKKGVKTEEELAKEREVKKAKEAIKEKQKAKEELLRKLGVQRMTTRGGTILIPTGKTISAKDAYNKQLIKNEEKRIKEQREKIKNEGGKSKTKILTDKATGNKIKRTVTSVDKIKNGKKIQEKIIEKTNMDTGEYKVETYSYNKETNKFEKTGGLNYGKGSAKNIQQTKELNKKLETERKRLEKAVNEGKLTKEEAQKIYDAFKNARIREFNKKFTKEIGGVVSESKSKAGQAISNVKSKLNEIKRNFVKTLKETDKDIDRLIQKNMINREETRTELNKIKKERAKEFQKLDKKVESALKKAKTKKQKQKIYNEASNEYKKLRIKYSKKGQDLANDLYLASGKGVALQALGFGKDVVKLTTKFSTDKDFRNALGRGIKKLATDKKAQEEAKKIVGEEWDKYVTLVKTSPTEAIIMTGGSFIAGSISGKIFKPVKKVAIKGIKGTVNVAGKTLMKSKAIRRGVSATGRVVIATTKKGERVIKLNRKLPSGKKINLKVGTIKDTGESLRKQLGYSGKKLVAVSAQANKLVNFLKRKAIVRKPFPFDEKKLSKEARSLLKKFDKGQLKGRKVLRLNKLLREETKRMGVQKKGVDLLERSTYFDPDRTLRYSRLKVGDELAPEEGNLFDLITGRATLFKKRVKPQILVIEEFAEKLPKTKEFRGIIKKIKKSVKSGKDPNLTKEELAKLSKWQVTPSGKLKPIGSTTYQGGLEREVTIAPGEIIKRVKKLGTLKYKGKKIPIVAVKIVKGKKKIAKIKNIRNTKNRIKNLKNKLKKTKSKKQRKEIKSKLNKVENKLKTQREKIKSKEVKNFLRERRLEKAPKKVYPLGKKARKSVKRLARTTARKVPRKTTVRKKPSAKKTTTRTTARKVPRKITARATPKPRPSPRKTTARATPKPRPSPRKTTTRPRPSAKKTKPRTKRKTKIETNIKRLSKPTQLYKVYAKKGGKNILVNKRLTRADAKNLLAYKLDKTLLRSAVIKKDVKSKLATRVPLKYRGSFEKAKKKLRQYKIKSKSKVPIKGYIEKTKYAIDTKKEKKQLKKARKKKKKK